MPAPPLTKFQPHKIQFCIKAFGSDAERALSHQTLRDMLGTLTRHNLRWLRANPWAPSIYYCGIRYEEEPIGQEDWCDLPTVLQQGWGDCEDLACARAAELLARGVRCWPDFAFRKLNPELTLYHIFVRLPSGAVEDPSKRLGMGRKKSQFAALDQFGSARQLYA